MKRTTNRRLYKSAISICLLITISNLAFAQSEETSIRASVDKLFDGMRSGDSSLVRSAFTSQAILTSVSINEKDSVVISNSKADGFVAAVGKPHTEKWDERISNVKISVDGPMATVWAPYKFFRGETFSHCGVNVFTMIKTKTGWKINAITDTRRKANCP
ncbi:nuclear transport factor 2 family protein [Dyadobacter sp. CY345]|uniref:nuclear transport factor 2 family protein n=1 Tax=Dyadobacter sp. CY345 TaxID=2909335 RepID=UPI001F33A490|nr:nuclear transport factor 2 family protein [Dyadobacter sp. CY345]MCF2445337.1 nuclear transport factor 2 family protein [Dyadobacter sp. CY345]